MLDETLNLNDRKHTWNGFESVYDINLNYPISAIHAPLLSGIGDLTIENMLDADDIIVLFEMCRIADMYGKAQNKIITLVIHSESYLSLMTDVGGMYYKIRRTLDMLFKQYSNVRIAIENVSPLRNLGKGKVLHLSNNFGYDNVCLVKQLKEDLQTDRIGTILDTCHSMITEKYMSAIFKEIGNYVEPEDYSMERFFAENKDVIFHIHFADMKGCGYGKGNHGISFTEETKRKAYSILDLYKKYAYTCPLCIEVEEPDGYEINTGFKTTKQIILDYFTED